MATLIRIGLECFANAADCPLVGENAQVVAKIQSNSSRGATVIVWRVLIVVCMWCREESNSERGTPKTKIYEVTAQ